MKNTVKQKLLLIGNSLLFVCALIQMSTAMGFTTGTAVSGAYSVHTFTGYAMFALIAFHLFLNFSWIKGQFGKKK